MLDGGGGRRHFPIPSNGLSHKWLHQLPECAHGAAPRICRNTVSRSVVSHSQRSIHGGSVAMPTADWCCRHCAQDAVLKQLRDQLMSRPREVKEVEDERVDDLSEDAGLPQLRPQRLAHCHMPNTHLRSEALHWREQRCAAHGRPQCRLRLCRRCAV